MNRSPEQKLKTRCCHKYTDAFCTDLLQLRDVVDDDRTPLTCYSSGIASKPQAMFVAALVLLLSMYV